MNPVNLRKYCPLQKRLTWILYVFYCILTTGAGDKAKKNFMVQSYVAMPAAAGLDYALLDMLNDEVVAAAMATGILAKEELFSRGMVPG